jgi:molecular chaperone HtpG
MAAKKPWRSTMTTSLLRQRQKAEADKNATPVKGHLVLESCSTGFSMEDPKPMLTGAAGGSTVVLAVMDVPIPNNTSAAVTEEMPPLEGSEDAPGMEGD